MLITAAAAEIDLSALALSPWEIVLRLMCAMLIGAIIGTEREYTHRPAGMRTHMLVALGACAVMVTSQMIFCQYRVFGATPDPARLSAQVITGVGFLGAGTIMREGPSIKGLTTAASIWAVACLGIAVGAGYYLLGIAGMVCMMVTLVVFEWLQNRLMHSRYMLYRFHVACHDVVAALDRINALAASEDVSLTSIQVDENGGKFAVSFRADFGGRHSDDRMHRFFKELSKDGSTASVQAERCRM